MVRAVFFRPYCFEYKVKGNTIMKEKILHILKEAQGYVSGQDLSRMLSVSRSAVWKSINALRKDGYVIDSVTNKGYCLQISPDILSAGEVCNGLATKQIGKKLLFFSRVDSTNEELKRRARTGAESGLVCTAEQQIAGKGRLGRSWVSPPGTGIFASVLLRPDIPPTEVPGITLAAGLAVCRAVQTTTGCKAKIKWPNDVLIGNKKLCGILTEIAAEADKVDFIIIGIGINTNNAHFPEEIAHKATSLLLETGHRIDRRTLLREVLKQLEIYTDEFFTDATGSVVNEYKTECATLGRQVQVLRGKEMLEGTAVDISDTGALIIQQPNGVRITASAGDTTVQGLY